MNRLLKELNILKIFAMLFVVLGHCTVVYTGAGIFKTPVSSKMFSLLTTYIYSFHVPLFIFISGAIYYYCKNNKNKYSTLTELILDKFKRLLIPFFCIASFYMIPIKMMLKIQGQGSYIDHVKNVILGKNVGHLWFLFIICYFFEKLMNKCKIKPVVSLAIFIIFNLISNNLINIFFINRAFQYSIYFYLGYLMFHNKLKLYNILDKTNKYIIGIRIILIFITSLILILLSKIVPQQNLVINITLQLLSIIIATLGIYMWYLIVYILSNRLIKIIQRPILNIINANSFGIYLLHEPLIFILLYFISDKYINPIVVVLLSITVAIGGSILIINLYKLLVEKFKYRISIVKTE